MVKHLFDYNIDNRFTAFLIYDTGRASRMDRRQRFAMARYLRKALPLAIGLRRI